MAIVPAVSGISVKRFAAEIDFMISLEIRLIANPDLLETTDTHLKRWFSLALDKLAPRSAAMQRVQLPVHSEDFELHTA